MSAPKLNAGATPPSETAPLGIIEQALALLGEEKRVFLEGRYEQLATIIAAKTDVLERLERIIPGAARNGRFIAALKHLIDESRRNELLIQAAQQGLSHARRRLKAIHDMQSGAVAYAEDGSRISSNADLVKNRSTA